MGELASTVTILLTLAPGAMGPIPSKTLPNEPAPLLPNSSARTEGFPSSAIRSSPAEAGAPLSFESKPPSWKPTQGGVR